MYDDVVSRLKGLGFSVTESHQATVTYFINRAEADIKREINCTNVPKELYYTHVDMATGLFLRDMKNTGQLGENFDFTAPAKSISEGDVSVTYAGETDGSLTPEARFDRMVNNLVDPPKSVFAAFRRLKW